jgi:hypothetical protein
MKPRDKIKNYIEWLSAEELHCDSQDWISKLSFAKDEQVFLNHLITDYSLDLLDSQVFREVRPIIEMLEEVENNHVQLFKRVKLHDNQLQIMVDDVNQLKMEEAYVETHLNLNIEVNEYFEKYQSVKTSIFNIISSVMKKRKQKRLLKP